MIGDGKAAGKATNRTRREECQGAGDAPRWWRPVFEGSGQRPENWVLRFRLNSKRHDMGLGAFPGDLSLAEARDEADKWHKYLKEGGNPLEAQRAKEAEAAKPSVPPAKQAMTFDRAMREFLEAAVAMASNVPPAAHFAHRGIDVCCVTVRFLPRKGFAPGRGDVDSIFAATLFFTDAYQQNN